MQNRGKILAGQSSQFFHFMMWLLFHAFFFPSPGIAAPAGETSPDAHVLRRLNGPERQADIEAMHRANAAMLAKDENAREEGEGMISPPPPLAFSPSTFRNTTGGEATASPERPDSSRPQAPASVGEALFNHAAGFMGVPGLAPRRGSDGSLDEGLGFHQDGTARKAGGVTGVSGPSGRGQRARASMQSGLRNGYGLNGMFEPGYDPATGFNYRVSDPEAGGRISGRNGYFRDMSDFDPMSMALDRGLSYGAGFLNNLGEAGISSLVDGGRARLNFYLDKDGYFSGEGDALLPFYDGTHSTVFTQLGLRSMSAEDTKDRWIGNFGLGQRWFPLATGGSLDAADYDAGNWMIGYNAFFDYDFTRDHQRGGIGLETQVDWLRLSSNYYFPISNWRGSYDFDSRFVKERPAEGWDARVKAYLPFYRNVAITGAYTQWYGDHVGMFGASDLEKDPRVWSYGLEYTPVPLVSGFITQKSTERGRTDTEFGLNFTYHFQMPWEDQISHSKVAELRTVGGSRHEFVDRENRIILEYKAKNAYRIEYLGRVGSNTFKFRIMDGFGKYKAGQTVNVSANGVTLAEAPVEKTFFAQAVDFLDGLIFVSSAHAATFSRSYTSDGKGEFIVRLDDVTSTPVVVTIQAGGNTQSFTLAEAELSGGLSASASTVANSGMVTLNLKTPDASSAINWNVTGPGQSIATPTQTDASGKATATLTAKATGSGDITVTATVNGTTYTCTVTIGVSYALTLTPTNGPAFVSGASSEANITAVLTKNGVAEALPGNLTWTVESSSITAAWWGNRSSGAMNGLSWGQSTISLNGTDTQRTDMSGNGGTAPTGDTAYLTDIVGSRTVTVKASIVIDGATVSQTATVSFGPGPLSVFAGAPKGTKTWADAATACGGIPGNISSATYQRGTNLPTQGELQAVAGSGSGGKQGAAHAAGWPDDEFGAGWFYYWTGEANGNGYYAGIVLLHNGRSGWADAAGDPPVAVCLP